METDSICFMSALDQACAVRDRRLSPVEIVDAVLRRIDEVNPPINAFAIVGSEQAKVNAARATEMVASVAAADLPPLHGVPITVKDLTPTAGLRTGFGVHGFRDNVPDVDGLVWNRLKSNGAILVGKTTTPDFGFLGTTESSLTGLTRNPWSLDRTTGGSSGGAAAAVAAGMGSIATGSDGSGSIRVPAAFCGVVGLKPSLGRVPLWSEDSVYSITDSIGPLARTVADTALLLTLMAGPDDRDPFSLNETVNFIAALEASSVTGLRVAVSPNLGIGPVEDEVADGVKEAARAFDTDLQALVEEVDLHFPDPREIMLDFWLPATTVLIEDTVAPNMPLSDVHPLLVEMAEAGRGVSSANVYRAAIIKRDAMYSAAADVFAEYDLLLTPTTPLPAFPHNPKGGPEEIAGVAVHPIVGFFMLTAPWNWTGHPAITVPCGWSSDGLPMGLQIIGRKGADVAVLRAAAAFEQARPWSRRRPPTRAMGDFSE